MLRLNLAHKVAQTLKIKIDKDLKEPEYDNFPLREWYVKFTFVDRKRFTLFLEKNFHFMIWAEGVNAKNIETSFKKNLVEFLYIMGLSYKQIDTFSLEKEEIYFGKTSDKRWIGISNEVTKISEGYLEKGKSVTSGLKPLLFYQPNHLLVGGPDYITPDTEVRKFFNLEERKEEIQF